MGMRTFVPGVLIVLILGSIKMVTGENVHPKAMIFVGFVVMMGTNWFMPIGKLVEDGVIKGPTPF